MRIAILAIFIMVFSFNPSSVYAKSADNQHKQVQLVKHSTNKSIKLNKTNKKINQNKNHKKVLKKPKYKEPKTYTNIELPLHDVGQTSFNTNHNKFGSVGQFISINKVNLLRYNKNNNEVESILANIYYFTPPKVDKRLVLAIIETESGFNPKAIHKGNYGLGQINLKSHYRKISKQEALEIQHNIKYITSYLNELSANASNNRQLINLYNSNSKNGSNKDYVNKILNKMNKFKDV